MKKSILVFILFSVAMTGYTQEVEASETDGNTSDSEVINKLSKEYIEKRVRDYFPDLPVMTEIARCESDFQQFDQTGAVLRGGTADKMIGIFQFNEDYHPNPSYTLGQSINTIEGNLAYARHLYEKRGTEPWNASKYCWEKAVPDTAPTVAKTSKLSSAEISEMENRIRLLLQLIELLKQLKTLQGLQ